MGLFSGGNSSSSPTTTTTETNFTNTDDRQQAVEAGLAGVAGDHNYQNIEVLDGGAVDSAFEFASESQMFWGENFDSVLNTIEATNENSVMGQRVIADAFNNDKAINATSGIASVIPLLSGVVLIGGLVFGIKALKG